MTTMHTTIDEGAAPVARSKPAGLSPARRAERHQRYQNFLRWVRKTHGWFGLWGALLGLSMGFSGIWLNHRAVLKLPPMSQQRVNAQLALPEPAPATAGDMAAWLQTALALDGPPNSMRVEPARPVGWTEKDKSKAPGAEPQAASSPGRVPPLMQPEHWVFNFGGPNAIVQADYWRGNRSVGVTTTHNGIMATLTNMHKGTGMPIAWILLIDTVAGSMIFLSLSGVVLWLQTNRRRAVGLSIFSVSVALTVGLALSRL